VPIQIKDAGALLRYGPPMQDDDIIRRIERFHFHRAPIAVERRGKGYTLFHAGTGHPIARLRPYGRDDLMEIFYWSLWRERWRPTGPFGCTVVPLSEALRIIDKEPIFTVGH
jgi:hypothetical protein